ncbi:hypothetical protein M5689_013076 [Euphorbia peplus]|nr:hypothetical protein M5689_013076 [Euphorbia peplus]
MEDSMTLSMHCELQFASTQEI